MKKSLKFVWKYRWGLVGLLWIGFVAGATVAESGWWAGSFVVAAFVMGASTLYEVAKAKVGDVKEVKRDAEGNAATTR